MTNPTTPTPSKGGMPKWLIVLLIVLILIILGCCGGLTTCFFLAKKGLKTASDPALWQNVQKQIEDGQRDAMNRAAAEQAAANAGNAPTTPLPPTTPPAASNGASTPPSVTVPSGSPAAPSGDSAGAAMKLPSTFPTDIPLEPGLTAAFPTWDNMAGTGAIVLKGNVKAEDAVSYYTTNMPKNGWAQTANQSFGTTTMMQYTKDARKVIVEVMAGDNNAGINVMLAVEKK